MSFWELMGQSPLDFFGNAVGPQNPYFLAPKVGLQDSKEAAGLIKTYQSWPVHCSTVDRRTTRLNCARPFIWEFFSILSIFLLKL